MLAYCGYDIHDLARHATFEEVCYLLWHGRLPTRAELGDLQSQLAAARPLPEADPAADEAAAAGDGMDALRTLTSALGHYDPDAHDNSPQANYRKAVRLTAQIGSHRGDAGAGCSRAAGPIAAGSGAGPRRELPLHADRRAARARLAMRAFDVALTLHADHELNASTFAARVAAATLTDIHSAIVGAIGTLKGPLHGGANADVMRMLLEIGQDAPAEKAEEVVRAQAGAQGEDPRLRPPRLPHRGSARDAPAPDVEASSASAPGSRSWFEMSRAHRGAGEGREEAVPERRLLLGVHLPRARHRRSICSRRSSRSAASRAGRRTCSSSTRTTA